MEYHVFIGPVLQSSCDCGSPPASLAGLYTLVSKSSSHQHRYSVSSTAQPAKLALEDGTIYQGTAIGSHGEIDGEVVFNTSMTGYQEILTDPSYRGQIVTMTYPLIGNYGVNEEDLESANRKSLDSSFARIAESAATFDRANRFKITSSTTTSSRSLASIREL